MKNKIKLGTITKIMIKKENENGTLLQLSESLLKTEHID